MIVEWRGLDAHKKVNGRKRQVAVDTLGLLWAVDVQTDSIAGCRLWAKLFPVSERLEKVLIDASYQGLFTQLASSLGIATEIATRPETAQGFVPVKQRWVVERTAPAARLRLDQLLPANRQRLRAYQRKFGSNAVFS